MQNSEKVKQIFTERAVPWIVRDIILKTCQEKNCQPIDLLGKAKFAELVACRKEIFSILRDCNNAKNKPRFTYAKIGKWFAKDKEAIRCLISGYSAIRKSHRKVTNEVLSIQP